MLKKEKTSNKLIILIGILCIIFGISLIGNNYFLSKKDKVYERMSFELSSVPDTLLDNTLESDEELSDSEAVIDDILNNVVVNNNIEEQKKPTTTITYDYVGYLEIPKINLSLAPPKAIRFTTFVKNTVNAMAKMLITTPLIT